MSDHKHRKYGSKSRTQGISLRQYASCLGGFKITPNSSSRYPHPARNFAPPRNENRSLIPKYNTPCHQIPINPNQTLKRSRRNSQSTIELHQPIGFLCCQCRYISSGSYCSNPDFADCPHRAVPRCRDCPIIFTPPRSNTGLGND